MRLKQLGVGRERVIEFSAKGHELRPKGRTECRPGQGLPKGDIRGPAVHGRARSDRSAPCAAPCAGSVPRLPLAGAAEPRHGTARHGRAGHGTARHGTARHGTARHGRAGHGRAQHGTAPAQGRAGEPPGLDTPDTPPRPDPHPWAGQHPSAGPVPPGHPLSHRNAPFPPTDTPFPTRKPLFPPRHPIFPPGHPLFPSGHPFSHRTPLFPHGHPFSHRTPPFPTGHPFSHRTPPCRGGGLRGGCARARPRPRHWPKVGHGPRPRARAHVTAPSRVTGGRGPGRREGPGSCPRPCAAVPVLPSPGPSLLPALPPLTDTSPPPPRASGTAASALQLPACPAPLGGRPAVLGTRLCPWLLGDPAAMLRGGDHRVRLGRRSPGK
ncbi:uncharacterized protein [Taeniopygia guttata]|uniref:uncharacterized protein n=1 Tax=Taeniopygia guttata TaxID=59729 RepID=UPI003BB94188